MHWSTRFATIQDESKSMKAPTQSLEQMKQKYILRSVGEDIDRIEDHINAGVQDLMFECRDYTSTNNMKQLTEQLIPSIN
jgi:hypothetical protein